MEEIQKKYNYIDAVAFLPGLDIQLSNFYFWLEDAWNIVLFDCMIKERVDIESDKLAEEECGDILLWIASFYTLYSDFHNIHRASPMFLINYMEFYEFLFDWKYYLSKYLESKIFKSINEYILNKKVCCSLELYNENEKCFSFICTEQGSISLPYEVLKAEVKNREKLIKKRIYSYFHNEHKKINNIQSINITTEESIMDFMFCLHWIVNYTDFNDKYFISLFSSCCMNEEVIKEYFNELAKLSYTSFVQNMDIPYMPNFSSNSISKLIKYTGRYLLNSEVLSVKQNCNSSSLDDGTELSKPLEYNFKDINLAFNWLKSWRSLK